MKIRFLMFGAMLHVAFVFPLIAQTTSRGNAETVKTAAQKLAADSSNSVEVKMSSGDKRKGRITSVNADSFTLLDQKSGNSQTITFADVDQIKKSGLSVGAWIAIGAAAAVAVIVGVLVRERYCNEQVC